MSRDKRAENRFDDLLSDMRSTIDAEIRDELAIIEPDFPAVVDELRRRDDGHLDADATPELNPVWGAASRSCVYGGDDTLADRGSADDLLSGLVDDARQEIEADLAARRLLPVPPLSDPEPSPDGEVTAPSRSEARLRWLGAGLALAASVALLWSLGPSLAQQLLGGAPTASQAQWSERADTEVGQTSRRAPAPERHRSSKRRGRAPTPVDTAGSSSIAEPPVEATPLERDDLGAPPDHALDNAGSATAARHDPSADAAPNARPGETKANKRTPPDLDALEAEAEALWRAGDRAGAETLLRTIIRRSRTRRRADLAYGDLFTITRQLYGREREAAVWREYLARFPSGRYADDARAGLCRREPAGGATGCWSRYLLDFPSGTHRDEAGRAKDGE